MPTILHTAKISAILEQLDRLSDASPGTNRRRARRVKFRAPSFVALEATATCMSDALVADLIAIVGSLDTVMGEVDR
jgi:NADH:ubiquinone oxidoreductase subunit D